MSCLVGLDISTTGAKALLIDGRGEVVASATTEYPLSTPRPLWAEQAPADWWEAACASLRNMMRLAGARGEEISAIGLSGQMHGLVLLDRAGKVLRPAILWNDQRTGPQCAEIAARMGGARELVALTGNVVLPGFTAPKLMWLRQNEPAVYAQIAHVLLPKDYVRFRLTGDRVTEVSDASGTSLLDVSARQWSERMLDRLEIPRDWLPRIVESPEVTGCVSRLAAQETGLAEGTPVVGGGGDQAAQAVGSGIVEPGVISVTTGTSGVVFAHADDFVSEPEGRLHAFCHAIPGKWHLMGVMLSAGGSFRWLRDQLGTPAQSGVDAYERLTQEAIQAPAGSEGLLFLPYLTGERTPYPDPEARGAFVGLTARHSRGHLVRAVLEGVSYGLRDSLELIQGLGVPIRQVRISGGGARSPLWRQIQADIFGVELVQVNSTEGAAFGAALLAGVGAGLFRSVEDAVAQTVRVTDRVMPNPEHIRRYQQSYSLYRALYPALRPTFHALASLSG